MPKKETTSSAQVLIPVISRAARALEEELGKPLGAGLYLVSTPIGNLVDISLRALGVLTRADLIFCEDTRHSRKLLGHFGLTGELQAYHEHNAARTRPRILARIRDGQSVALISDAGTPLISDPGHKLVRDVQDAGYSVEAIPGASAVLTALTSSGLPTDRFFFEGFLPPKREARRKRLEALRDIPCTLVFYESPQRLADMLRDASEVLGVREAAVAKELTKLHENVLRANLAELADEAPLKMGSKGEFVVLAGPPAPSHIGDDDIRARLKGAFREASFRDGVQDVSDMLNVSRKRVYKIALELKSEAAGEDGEDAE
jgi:16S rRNA (cytidine1402-2'-O)-methyltransferase